jgi:hypothetical protein
VASKAVEDAVDAALAAWAAAHVPVITVLTENMQAEAPADGSSFLIIQYPIASTTRPTVARGLYVEEGGFRIVINVERGRGTADMREMGAELGALFRDVALTNGVQCLVPTEPFTDDTSDQGNFFRGSLVVPFRYVYSA